MSSSSGRSLTSVAWRDVSLLEKSGLPYGRSLQKRGSRRLLRAGFEKRLSSKLWETACQARSTDSPSPSLRNKCRHSSSSAGDHKKSTAGGSETSDRVA